MAQNNRRGQTPVVPGTRLAVALMRFRPPVRPGAQPVLCAPLQDIHLSACMHDVKARTVTKSNSQEEKHIQPEMGKRSKRAGPWILPDENIQSIEHSFLH